MHESGIFSVGGMLEPNGFLVQGFIFGTGIIGQFYISKTNKVALYWWLATNSALILVSLSSKSYGMTGLYLFYSGMCFYSLRQWSKLHLKSIYRTIDGDHPAPYPGMTDHQLYVLECDMKVPNPTFKDLPEYMPAEAWERCNRDLG